MATISRSMIRVAAVVTALLLSNAQFRFFDCNKMPVLSVAGGAVTLLVVYAICEVGIGKSTLAEALTESIYGCVMLDGDRLIAVNPPHCDELEHLHSTIAMLVEHHSRYGYRNFVIDHIWRSTAELDDLRRRLLHMDSDIRCFLLTLPPEENLRRIELRASVRAIDELEFERKTVVSEREILASNSGGSLGEPFDVSATPAELVEAMLRRLGLR